MVGKQTGTENHESSDDLGVSHLKLGWFLVEKAWKVQEGVRTVRKDLGSKIWVDGLDGAEAQRLGVDLGQDERTNVGEVGWCEG